MHPYIKKLVKNLIFGLLGIALAEALWQVVARSAFKNDI